LTFCNARLTVNLRGLRGLPDRGNPKFRLRNHAEAFMPELISVAELSNLKDTTVIDVRKAPARGKSGLAMPGAVWRSPFSADSWWREFSGKNVVVFCVHGHEVSKAVAGFLNDQRIDARFLEGGFEAYREAGGAVVEIKDHE
jgi:thiosulfate sulfurtransferase